MRWRLALVAFVCAVLYCVAAVPQSNVIGGGIYGDAKNGGITYYVANGGSDSANGLTPGTAWQTISHVNGQTFAAGTKILFEGGETFSGAISFTTTNAPAGGLTVGSYGTGQPTISSTSSACVSLTDVPSMTVQNLNCAGSGDTSNGTNGVNVINDSASASLAGPTITGLTVTGYGGTGIALYGSNGRGFINPSVTNNTVDNVGGNAGATGTGNGIYITTSSTTNITASTNCTISGNIVYDVIGTAGTFSGSGVELIGCTGADVANNLVHDNGSLNATADGPVGIIAALCSGCIVEKNEVYNQSTANADGEGIDFDWSVTNSIMRYNYVHGNVAGLFFYSFNNSAAPWSSNQAYFNISQNNSVDQFRFGSPSATISGAFVFNNAFYSSAANARIVNQVSNGSSVGITFSNNIFYSLAASGNQYVNVAAASSLAFTNNDYYGNASYEWVSTNYTSFAAWQTASGQEKIGGSNVGLTSEPRLVVYGGGGTVGGYLPASLKQYQLQAGSPMLAAGLNINSQYGVTLPGTDFFGAAITASALPVGAGQQIAWANGAGTCPQATAFLARASSPPTATQEQYNALICGRVADGTWSLYDVQYKFATDSQTDAVLNLASSSYPLTLSGTIPFTANGGIQGDGSTGFGDTGLNPSTASGLNYGLNSARVSAFVTLAGTRSGISLPAEIGAADGSDNNDIICPDCSANSNFLGGINTNYNNVEVSGSTAILGDWDVDRSSPSAMVGYLNGASIGSVTTASSALPAADILIATWLNNYGFSPDRISYASIGASETPSQILFDAYRTDADCIETVGPSSCF